LTSNATKNKAERGIYTLVDPLDYMLLGLLPKEGELVFGLYPLGETVTALVKKFTPEQQKHLKTSMVSGRLVAMHVQGLVANSPGRASDRKIWQRTAAGEEAFNKWKGANGGSTSGGTGGS
jgi:hypothetical protein